MSAKYRFQCIIMNSFIFTMHLRSIIILINNFVDALWNNGKNDHKNIERTSKACKEPQNLE